jgi:GPH family glycoside/pentoside/hexuronide:cation symporter
MHLTQKLIYALPAIPLAALTLPIMIYLPTFYAQDMGMGLAMVGVCLLIARMIDVISDPLIGILSDRTNSKYGRRKIWVIGGLLPTLIGTWFLLNPPFEQASVFYFIGFSCLLYIGWTCMLLPLNALGAELSKDYNERTSITSWREGFTTLGLLIPLSIVAAMGYAGEDSAGKALNIIAILTVILLPLCTIIFWFGLREKNQYLSFRESEATRGILNPSHAFRMTKKTIKTLDNNTPFKRLIFSFLINSMANALPATLFLLFVEHIIGAKDQAGGLLFIYFLSGIIGIPFWYWLSKKTSKHRAWSYAMIFACCVFLTVPFIVGAGDTTVFLIICVLTGLTLGADLALPASIQADVVDVDRDMTGENRTGLFFAMWSMVTKLSLALSAGIFLPLLALTGFNEVSGDNAYALPYFYAFVPVILKIIAIIPMWNFPLTKK